MSPAVRRSLLIVLHLAVVLAVIVTMRQRHEQRSTEVAALRSLEQEERALLEERRQRLAVQRARLAGLDADDPYVVELIAREKYDFHSPGESRPPPMPITD